MIYAFAQCFTSPAERSTAFAGKIGQILELSIIDRAVGGAERLLFEGGPALASHPAWPRSRSTTPRIHVGYYARHSNCTAQRTCDNKPRALAFRLKRPCIANAMVDDGVLPRDFELEFDDHQIGRRTVAEVLAAPDQFVDETMPDPIERVDYRRGKAKLLRNNRSGQLLIHSFAHGERRFSFNERQAQGITIDDFYALMTDHKYIFTPSHDL